MIRVVVVDDHRLVRAGLVGLLEEADDLEVAGQAADGVHAIEVVRSAKPDVVLMDISMPVMDGIAATTRIVDEHPDVRVVALTSFSEHSRVAEMLAAGAVGYLLKDCDPQELLTAVRA